MSCKLIHLLFSLLAIKCFRWQDAVGPAFKKAFCLHLSSLVFIYSTRITPSLCLYLQRWRTTSLRMALKCVSTPVWKAWRTTCWETEDDLRFPTPGSGIRLDTLCCSTSRILIYIMRTYALLILNSEFTVLLNYFLPFFFFIFAWPK